MAKGWKKRGKKKFKKRFKKYSRKGSSKKYKRTQMRAVKPTGIRKRLDTSPEMKITYSEWTGGISLVSTAGTVLWANNYRWSAGVRCIQPPTSGVSQVQYIGTQFNSLFCDVRILMECAPPTGDTHNFTCAYRIICARMRTTDNNETSVATYSVMPNNVLDPVDTKLWDLYYDKTFCCNTGYQGAYLGNQVGNIIYKGKVFRFKIPLKMTLTPKAGIPLYPYPIIILGIAQHTGYMFASRINTKFYYKDP